MAFVYSQCCEGLNAACRPLVFCAKRLVSGGGANDLGERLLGRVSRPEPLAFGNYLHHWDFHDFFTAVVSQRWQYRLGFGVFLLLVHPFLLKISYNTDIVWQRILMETLVTSGDFNKYPVIPWFALSLHGSVMAQGWFEIWKTNKERILYGLGIATLSVVIAFSIRLFEGYGNLFAWSEVGSISFFVDQKYPPSLFHHTFFFGMVVFGVTMFMVLNQHVPRLTTFFAIPGKVPMFFYAVHLSILGIFVKRPDFFYLEGGILATFVGFAAMLAIMLPLSNWFYKVKARSNNFFIRMI